MAKPRDGLLRIAIKGDLKEYLENELKVAAGAMREGLEITGHQMRRVMRVQTRRAGLGHGMEKSWKIDVYPTGKVKTLHPALVLRTDSPTAMSAFLRGVTIRPKGGQMLAIPTDAAPEKGYDGERISPANFPTGKYGELKWIHRPGKPTLGVVDNVRIRKSGLISRQVKGGSFTKRGRYKKGVATVVMFILVRQATIQKRLSLDPARQIGERRLARNIIAAWNRAEGRRNTDG